VTLVTDFTDRVIRNVETVIIGKRQQIEALMVALLCQGHVLIEDVPGTGKTMLARAVAASMGIGFKRLQCTPDLLPNDITGVNVFNQQTSQFEFRPGPVFVNILLSDEINRATPRAQAALLEAMQERQVSADGVTRALPSIELVALFILLKIGSFFGDPWADVVAELRAWPDQPSRIVDLETGLASVLVFLSWFVSTETARDLERLDEASDLHREARPPLESLASRFFWGGALLLIVSGLARVGLSELLDVRRPSVSGLVVNALVYFVLGLVAMFLMFLVSIPFWLLARLVFSGEEPVAPPTLPAVALPLYQDVATRAPLRWDTLRSLLFWIALSGVVAYVLRGYLHDHSELLEALRRFAPFRALYGLWLALRRGLGRWVVGIRERLPRRSVVEKQRKATVSKMRRLWPGARSLRERVFHYYWSILRRAKDSGIPRHPSQTPYEYGDTLNLSLVEAREEMDRVTGAFVEARYSLRQVEPKQADRVRAAWQRVMEALKTRTTNGDVDRAERP
jgi:hypothetical protein